jgi:hypothetical protein
MSLLTPVNLARGIGAGRIAIGLGLLAAPTALGRSWLGEDGVSPAAQVVLRGMGARDALIGMAQVHTAADPERGHRWARTSAIADLTDLVATVMARRSLPPSGVRGTIALAGGAAVSGLVTSRLLPSAR